MSQKLNEIWNELEEIKRGPNYKRSFVRIIDNSNPKKDNRNPFHYRNNILTFVGRSKELKRLQGFLDDERDLLWMSVTGEGGTGKSKLIYHFSEKLKEQPAWKTIWVTRNLMNSIMTIKEYNEWDYPCNLLLIVDYATEMADELGDWIECLTETKKRPAKMRFVLIEREHANINRKTIGPIWYSKLMNNSKRERCIKELHYEDIVLHSLNAEDYSEVILEFASYVHKKELTNTEVENIMEASRNLDPHNQLPRVLFVIIATDAYVRNSNFSNWNVEKLIENVLERHKDHWRSVIGETFDVRETNDIMKSLLDMLLYATATGGWWPYNEKNGPVGPFAESAKRIADLEIRGSVFSMVNFSSEETDKLNALEPDLIGECYVLIALKEMYYQNKNVFKKMIEALWAKKYEFCWFIIKCLENYYNNEEFSVLFDRNLEPILPENISLDTYALLLNALVFYGSPDKAEMTIKVFERIAKDHADDEHVILSYAESLCNLAKKQPEEKKKVTLDRLKELVTNNIYNEKIIFLYVRKIIEIAEMQSKEKAQETIFGLEEFVKTHANDSLFIIITYIQSLIDLAEEQPEEIALETMARLKRFAIYNADNFRIIYTYVNCFASLAEKQQKEKALESIAELENFVEVHANKYLSDKSSILISVIDQKKKKIEEQS